MQKLLARPTTLNLGNYWERVVVPMQNSPWWLHPRPRDALAPAASVLGMSNPQCLQ